MENLSKRYRHKCLIFNLDPKCAMQILDYVSALENMEVIGHADNVKDTIRLVQENGPIEFLFLGTGSLNPDSFQIALMLRDLVKCIVFYGEDKSHALDVFHAGGDHFMVSPISFTEFCKVISRMQDWDKLGMGRINSCEVEEKFLRVPILFLTAQPLQQVAKVNSYTIKYRPYGLVVRLNY